MDLDVDQQAENTVELVVVKQENLMDEDPLRIEQERVEDEEDVFSNVEQNALSLEHCQSLDAPNYIQGSKRGGRTTLRQFEILVSFMEEHPEAAVGKIHSKNARHKARELWESVTAQLNARGPPVKQSDAWRDTWNDWKSAAKKRWRLLYKDIPDGEEPKGTLNKIDERLIALISKSPLEGDGTTRDGGFEVSLKTWGPSDGEEIVTLVEPVREAPAVTTRKRKRAEDEDVQVKQVKILERMENRLESIADSFKQLVSAINLQNQLLSSAVDRVLQK